MEKQNIGLPSPTLLTGADGSAASDGAAAERHVDHFLQKVKGSSPSTAFLTGTDGRAVRETIRLEALFSYILQKFPRQCPIATPGCCRNGCIEMEQVRLQLRTFQVGHQSQHLRPGACPDEPGQSCCDELGVVAPSRWNLISICRLLCGLAGTSSCAALGGLHPCRPVGDRRLQKILFLSRFHRELGPGPRKLLGECF